MVRFHLPLPRIEETMKKIRLIILGYKIRFALLLCNIADRIFKHDGFLVDKQVWVLNSENEKHYYFRRKVIEK